MNIKGSLEKCRVREGGYKSSAGDQFGAFCIPYKSSTLRVLAAPSEGCEGWEHVSVSLPNRCPNWPEMCFIKDLFWNKEETVVQFHPPESKYINNHHYCLHLWRYQKQDFPIPPSILVGVNK